MGLVPTANRQLPLFGGEESKHLLIMKALDRDHKRLTALNETCQSRFTTYLENETRTSIANVILLKLVRLLK